MSTSASARPAILAVTAGDLLEGDRAAPPSLSRLLDLMTTPEAEVDLVPDREGVGEAVAHDLALMAHQIDIGRFAALPWAGVRSYDPSAASGRLAFTAETGATFTFTHGLTLSGTDAKGSAKASVGYALAAPATGDTLTLALSTRDGWAAPSPGTMRQDHETTLRYVQLLSNGTATTADDERLDHTATSKRVETHALASHLGEEVVKSQVQVTGTQTLSCAPILRVRSAEVA